MASAGKTTYTQGHDKATLASHSSRTAEVQADYLLPHIKPTHHILDIGCGPGSITLGLAKYASEGQVIGVDSSAKVIEHAKETTTLPQGNENAAPSNLSFQVAGAHDLPFEDETFDIVHCHAVLVHLPDPQAAMREMHRVCKSGGYLAAREPDLESCVIYPLHQALEKWRRAQSGMQRIENAEPNAGRHLAAWAGKAGFVQGKIQVSSNTLQYFGEEQVRWWGEMYAKRMDGDAREKAIRTGVISSAEVDEVRDAYL